MKTSPYLQYAYKKLIQEGKFHIFELNGRKSKVFEQVDIWEKMLDFHEMVQKIKKEN